MMEKGVYSAVIGLFAIIVIAITIINANALMQTEDSVAYSAEFVKVKKDWQNVRYLADKATSDALADFVEGRNCDLQLQIMGESIGIVDGYFDRIGESIDGCSAKVFSYEFKVEGGNYIANIIAKIECKKNIGNGNITYSKNATFNKQIETAEPCEVKIKDLQSGLYDV